MRMLPETHRDEDFFHPSTAYDLTNFFFVVCFYRLHYGWIFIDSEAGLTAVGIHVFPCDVWILIICQR
jgi:hypothetical protein